MQKVKVIIGGDHRGFPLKAKALDWLLGQDYKPLDLGAHSDERCDAFDYARRMAQEIQAHPDQLGILICGSGQAMAMTANRFRGMRAALCVTPLMAVTARQHNDANILALGADFVDEGAALKTIEAFLETKFLGGRYAERLEKLHKLGGV